VADIRLSGAYELADTERVLEIVAEELSLELRYRSNYWITIGPRS
jgi:transmembrane sensor